MLEGQTRRGTKKKLGESILWRQEILCGVKLLSCPLALRRDSMFVFWAQLRDVPCDLGDNTIHSIHLEKEKSQDITHD